MDFSFSATKLRFGVGTQQEIAEHAKSMGSRVRLMTGSKPERLDWLRDDLHGLAPLVIAVAGEPTINDMAGWTERARAYGCDVVVAVGGGSVIDSGKALAALLTNTRDILDYLEVVGKGMVLTETPAPMIAVPTTSGTGAEATANAVLGVPEQGVKVSMRSTLMLPDLAIVDPQLTATMPPAVTAATGMDALTQLMEAFVSIKANPLTDGLCREGMIRAARSLRRAYDDGADMDARTDMALASHFSGIALANAKLGAVHGFAAPLGGSFHAPHGAVCAALLPHVMDVNVRGLVDRGEDGEVTGEANGEALARYAETAQILTGNMRATPADGVAWVSELAAHLKLAGIGSMGVTEGDFDALAKQAAKASSMQGNPLKLTHDELMEILRRAM